MKTYADSTMMGWTKRELVEYARCCQINQEAAEKALEQHIENVKDWEPPQRWIPVSERLPEECEEVNITWVNTDPAPYYQGIKNKPFTGSGVYCRGRWYWYSSTCKDYCQEYGSSPNDEMNYAIKVTAWREFPDPYKETDDERH